MATVRFHRSLYNETAIRSTVETFADFARCGLETSESYFEVSIEPTADVLETELLAEFSNHVLARTVEEKRAA